MSRPGKQFGRPLPDGWLTTQEAAERIGVTRNHVCHLIHDPTAGIVAKRYVDPQGKFTNSWIVDAWSLDEYAVARGEPRVPRPTKGPRKPLWGPDMSPDGRVKGRATAAPEELPSLPESDVWMTREAAATSLQTCSSTVRRMQREGRFALTLCVRGIWYIARSCVEQVKHEDRVGVRRRLEER